ncbi:hypothetical protein LTR53_015108 [Teratosphaeriaceae sp. CCFEE 6253]|nr:hypothetical protein LTR53_015108 [Teratosphaeriaceae sp. CCFEE 6253]
MSARAICRKTATSETTESGTPSNGVQTPACHLLRLPPELRLHIYSYLWPASKIYLHIAYSTRGQVHARSYCRLPMRILAILRTCRELHHEAAQDFYARAFLELSFRDIQIRSATGSVPMLVVGTSWMRHLRRLRIAFWLLDTASGEAADQVVALDSLVNRVLGYLQGTEGAPHLTRVEFFLIRERDVGTPAAIMRVLTKMEFTGRCLVRMHDDSAAGRQAVRPFLADLGDGATLAGT